MSYSYPLELACQARSA